MTIKKRLFISNLIMTIAPFVISIATVIASISILNMVTNGEYVIRGDSSLRAVGLAEGDFQTILLTVAVALFFCSVVVLTNRLLTKFVFKKIMHPLEMLGEGVQHIREGNLNYKIEFSEQN